MTTAVICFTQAGFDLGVRLISVLGDGASLSRRQPIASEFTLERCQDGGLADWTSSRFDSCEALVFIGSTGIAVRAIADHIRSKISDPAVVVIDEQGQFVIPILSGHIGGANALARRLASALDAIPVLTTATDARGLFAIDDWARGQGLRIANPDQIKKISSALLAGRPIHLASEFPIAGALPDGIHLAQWGSDHWDVLVTCRTLRPDETDSALHLVPPVVTAGIGCRKGTSSATIQSAVAQALADAGYDSLSLAGISSIDLKSREPGLIEFCECQGLSLRTFTAEQLASREGEFTPSAFVESVTGVDNVCERAAIAASEGYLVAHKQSYDGVTVALALREPTLTWNSCDLTALCASPSSLAPAERANSSCARPAPGWAPPGQAVPATATQCDSRGQMNRLRGSLALVGMGPGSHDGMTFEADEALRTSDVIIGYKRYVQLLRPMYPDKEYISTGMTHEADRCQEALGQASTGKRVSLVSSGDPGVYAMAGLTYELSQNCTDMDIRVIPGVTAATSGAALLGAPIGHDFAVISLSDRLTDWDLIEDRLDAAARADFCVVLYNPSSRTRANHLARACDVLLRHKSPQTICGLAARIGREGQSARTTTLAGLGGENADMFTTVFVGNRSTRLIDGKMVTPRGYPTQEMET